MNAAKLRRLIRTALVKAVADGVGMDDLPDRVATLIELALEIEADDQDTEYYAAAVGAGNLRPDLNAISRDGWTAERKISDSLAPPLQPGSSVIAAKEADPAPVVPIRPSAPEWSVKETPGP